MNTTNSHPSICRIHDRNDVLLAPHSHQESNLPKPFPHSFPIPFHSHVSQGNANQISLVSVPQGPLGKVWIAATLGESRVPKAFATSANIHVLCRDVEHPAAPFALRLSASLLLGITRVYSRKSSIILSDVNSVYHLLSTTLTALQQQNTSRKRARPNVAHVSEITMSTTTAVKKQRLGVGNGMDLDLDAGTLMQESELERDILHAMHHTLLLHENAPVIHGMPFYASERDITIEAGSDNHSASLGLSLGDYNSSLEDVRRPLFHDDEHAEIEQGNGQQVTAGEGRRGQLPMTREAEHEERELLLLTPVDMKPLQLPTMPRHERHGTDSASGSARREKHSVLGSPPQQRGAELAQDALENNPVNDLLLDGDFGPLPPLDGFDDINLNTNPLQPSTAVAEPVALPQPQSQPQPEIELQPQPQPQPRKSWRGGAVVIDDQTEITVRDFRATLHDTSDIVNTGAAMFDLEAPRRTRSRSRRSSGTEHHVEYTLPSFFSRFAAEVRDLWQETVGDGMRRTDEEEGDGKGDTSTVGTIRGWRNNRKQPTVKDRHESSRTVVDNEEQDGGRVLDEVQIDFPSVQLEDEVYQEQQQQTELRGLSAEKMREGEGEGDGNIDAPSGLGSSAGGTGSGGARVSSLSAGASTNERQRVSALSHDRDRLFDFVSSPTVLFYFMDIVHHSKLSSVV